MVLKMVLMLQHLKILHLQSIKGLSEEIMRILGNYNIRTVFNTTQTLGRILKKSELTPPDETGQYRFSL